MSFMSEPSTLQFIDTNILIYAHDTPQATSTSEPAIWFVRYGSLARKEPKGVRNDILPEPLRVFFVGVPSGT
jgi:hypothetical protein